MNGGSEGSSNGDDRNLTEVRLEFETMRQLQAELAPTLSNDGFFIPTPDPSPPDTVLRFLVTLPEDFVLIEGTGVVIWVRYPGEEGGAAGMAVRYISLSRETQETIDAVIDAHLASGGGLFDLEPTAARDSTYPTDALGGSQPIGITDVKRSARDGTARQLEMARVTIRGESERDSGASPAGVDEEYLSSVEAQVEEAVASIAPQMPSDDSEAVDAPVAAAVDDLGQAQIDIRWSTDESIERVVGLLHDDEEPVPDVMRAADRQEPAIVMAEPLEPIIVDEAPEMAEPAPGEDSPVHVTDPEPGTGEPGGVGGESAKKEEGIESLIPVFLERWKQEIGGKPGEAPTEVEDAGPAPSEVEQIAAEDRQSPGISIAKTVAIEPEPVADIGTLEPTLAVSLPDESGTPTPDPVSQDEPVNLPGASFEVSGFEPMPDSDIVMTEQPQGGEDEVTLVPSEPPPSGGLRPIWLIPALLVVVVAVGVFLGWDRILGFVEGIPSSEQSAQEVVPAGEQPAEVVPALPEAETSPGDTVRGESVDDVEPATAAGTREVAPPQPTPEPPPRIASQPATRIESVTWRTSGDGTEVTIRGNGRIAGDSVSVFPMRDPARILVRVREIEEQYPEYEIAVNSSQIEKIRMGHHPEQVPPALYVVLDLADPLVGIADLNVEGDTVRIVVEVQ